MNACLCLAILMRIVSLPPGVSDPEWTEHMNAAAEHTAHRNYSEAERLYRAAAERAEKLPKPDLPRAAALNSLGYIFSAQGRYREAEQSYRGSIPTLERQWPERHAVGSAYVNLSDAVWMQGRLDEAILLAERALAIFESTPETPVRELRVCMGNLAILHRERGEYKVAVSYLRRVLKLLQEEGENGPQRVEVLNILTTTQLAMGDLAGAEETLADALGFVQNSDPDSRVCLLSNLASLKAKRGREVEAERAFAAAESEAVAALGSGHPQLAAILVNRAVMQKSLHDYAGAADSFRRALAIDEATKGASHPDLAPLLMAYRDVLRKLGRGAEARAMEQRARALPQRAGSQDLVSLRQLQIESKNTGR
jgi:tetratricopeptide (TPR) repeat protein